MMKALYLLLFVSGAALADDTAILNCRSVSDTASRLGCYDAIPVGAAAAAAAKTAKQDFGIEPARQQRELPKSVQSTIPGDFDGWRPGAQFKLANGQVWRVIDGSEASLPRMSNPKVTIERNMFGTLFMKFEGINHSPKVRRIQ